MSTVPKHEPEVRRAKGRDSKFDRSCPTPTSRRPEAQGCRRWVVKKRHPGASIVCRLYPPKADIGRQVMLAEEAKPLTYLNAMLQKKAADLIDHSGSLDDQARSHPVQCL